jgi:hypothetical protein
MTFASLVRAACSLGFALLLAAGLHGNAMAQSQSQPIDCTNGCYILTCNNGYCQLWYCSGATGCRVVAEFQEIEKSADASGARASLSPEVAYAKICRSSMQCDLYELGGKEALLLGTFDNLEGIVEEQRTLREVLRGFVPHR